jgi:ribonuclease BN (tRNA processing enzyme)
VRARTRTLASDDRIGAPVMLLTVLGTATPAPRPDQPCSGYLVRSGADVVALDLGPGALANLQRHVDLVDLSAVWISHLHADHWADLSSLFYELEFGVARRSSPLPVHAPPGCAERLRGFFAREDARFLENALEFHDLHDGDLVRLGRLELRSRRVSHDVEAYGVRVSDGDGVLAYSGDTAPCQALDELARDADLLLCECGAAGRPEDQAQVHLAPGDVGALAARAGVARLLVTHLDPTLHPTAVLDAVRRDIDGVCSLAVVHATYDVAAGRRRAGAPQPRGSRT